MARFCVPLVQDDFDALFNVSMGAATKFLNKSGEFFPFGVEVGADHQVAIFAADPGLGEFPPSTEVLRALADGARADREGLQAVGLVSDVLVAGGRDAVRIQLEHREGDAIEIIVPYRRRRLGRKVTLGEMSVSATEPLVFSPSLLRPQSWGNMIL